MFGWMQSVIVGVLDVLSLPGRIAVNRIGGDDDGSVAAWVTAFVIDGVMWLVVLAVVTRVLSTVSVAAATSWLEFATRDCGVSGIRALTRSATSLSTASRRVDRRLPLWSIGSESAPDTLKSLRTSHPSRSVLRHGAAVLLRIPDAIASALRTIGDLIRSPYLWSMATAATWTTSRSAAEQTAGRVWAWVQNLLYDNISRVTIIVGVLALAAVVIASCLGARIRGRFAWRSKRIENAHTHFHALSGQATQLHYLVHSAISEFSDLVPPLARRALASLTVDCVRWYDGSFVVNVRRRSIPNKAEKTHSFLQNFTGAWPIARGDSIAPIGVEMDRMLETHRTAIDEGVGLELFQLTPIDAEPAMLRIRAAASRYAGAGERPFTAVSILLSPDSIEQVITDWMELPSTRDLHHYFLSLEVGELPSNERVADARSAFTDLVGSYRGRIRTLCREEEEIRRLASVQSRLNRMGPVRRVLEAVGGR